MEDGRVPMKAEVRIQTGNMTGMLAKALGPEIQGEVSRTTVGITAGTGELVLSIAAEDAVALRAALNSYLRWTKLAIDAQEALGVE